MTIKAPAVLKKNNVKVQYSLIACVWDYGKDIVDKECINCVSVISKIAVILRMQPQSLPRSEALCGAMEVL